MAAVTHRAAISIRAVRPGEGAGVVALWRELWDAHEGWGGYPGCHDDAVYAELAARLNADARVRSGQPILGRHIHLIATWQGTVAGQVEGWVERHGVDSQTPSTCEVRSLIVASWARSHGIGQALLHELTVAARSVARGDAVVLAAEVLVPNPAHAFYARLGYAPVSWSLRVPSHALARVPATLRPANGEALSARTAEPRDALALCILDATLATRRRALGDTRYDPPRAVDAASVAAIASHVGQAETSRVGHGNVVELVTLDGQGRVRATASFVLTALDAPFRPGRRAVLGRFAADPARDARELIAPLIALGRRLAARADAPTLELTELSPPGTPLHQAAMASEGTPWSRILTKPVSPYAAP